jgi:hypothetical protein
MVGPKEADCMKLLQEGKVVAIYVGNKKTESAATAQKVISDFISDKRISGFAESISIDPDNETSKKFLNKLKIDAGSKAITILIVPPGKIISKYTDKFNSDIMFSDLARAISGSKCGSGATGASGCGVQSGCQ